MFKNSVLNIYFYKEVEHRKQKKDSLYEYMRTILRASYTVAI